MDRTVMMMNYRFLVNLILLGSLVVTSCQTIHPSEVVEPTQFPTVETVGITPSSTNASVIILPSPIQVLSDLPSFFWWSSDSSKLYYEKDGIWEFDIAKGTTSKSQVLKPDLLRCTYLPDVYNGTLLFQQNCSPSKERIIYYTILELSPRTSSPAPAPLDCNSGECPTPYDEGAQVELWLWENGVSRKIGQLLSCIKDHLWAENEQKLVAVGYDDGDRPISQTCDTTFYAWQVDLANHVITPLLPKADRPSEVFVHDYSPDGDFLLFTERQRLYLLDVQTQGETDLQIPRRVDNAWWLNENKILVLFYLQTGGYNMGWSILDIKSGNFTEVLNEANSIGEYILDDPVISPDGKWLAFTARYPSKVSYGFWLITDI